MRKLLDNKDKQLVELKKDFDRKLRTKQKMNMKKN